MLTVTVPQTDLDLQVILIDLLKFEKPSEFDHYFEVKQEDDKIYLTIQKNKLGNYVWVPKQGVWSIVNDYVRGLGGAWEPKQHRWEIPLKHESEGNHAIFEMANIDAIVESPFQFRRRYSEKRLLELANSIREHGILEPLIVRNKGIGVFELVAGHRRLRASKKIGLTRIPIFIRKMTDEEALFAQLVENLQREDANDYDIGKVLHKLTTEIGLEKVGRKIGLGKSQVHNYVEHYRFSETTFSTTVENVDLSNLKERQTRDLRGLKRDQEIRGIVSELEPEKIDGEVLREIWRRLRVPNQEYRSNEVQSFLTQHDYVTSLLRYEERGSFGDAYFPGNSPGFLMVQLIHHFKPKIVFDPMEGSGTNHDVCEAMGLEYYGNDLLKGGYNLVSQPTEKLPTNDLTFFHPPYWNLIRYSKHPDDLCNVIEWDDFLGRIKICIDKLLKRTKILAILIGDVIKKEKVYTPLSLLPRYEARLLRILIREYEILKGIHGFYDSISKGEIPQKHDYVILLKGDFF